LRDAVELSLAVPLLPVQQIFNPMDIRNTTHLRNAAVNHERFAIYQFPVERQITLNFSSKTPDRYEIGVENYRGKLIAVLSEIGGF
jgi:hypothetical protein